MYLVPFDRPILTPEMWQFWEENGYVMVPNAVPREHLDAAAAIWEFLEMDPDDPDTWYGYRPRGGGFWRSPISAVGIVEFYHHQALWDIRQHLRIYQIFAELLGERRLYVTYDRVNLLPPARADLPQWSVSTGGLHWDCETTLDPVPPDEQELRTRINAWQERIPIANPQGDPRGREKRQPVAALTELGRRLIGITPWDQEPAAARGGTLSAEVT